MNGGPGRPRYFRARQSHCIYTSNWHGYLFLMQPYVENGKQCGVSVKHRRSDATWKHWTIRWAWTPPIADAYKHGKVRCELVSHRSTESKSGRIPLTKRYVRFGAAL